MTKRSLNIALPEAIDVYFTNLARERFPTNRANARLLAKALSDGLYNVMIGRPECFVMRIGVDSLAVAVGQLRFPKTPESALKISEQVLGYLKELAHERTSSSADIAKLRKTPIWVAKKIEERARAIIDSASEDAVTLCWHQTVEEVFSHYVWHEFVPDPEVEKNVIIFANAVAGAIENPAAHPWINDINRRGQIRLLGRISSIEKALSRATEWSEQTERYLKTKTDYKPPLVIPGLVEGVDYEELDVGLIGEQWAIKMKSEAFLDQEGISMSNCIFLKYE